MSVSIRPPPVETPACCPRRAEDAGAGAQVSLPKVLRGVACRISEFRTGALILIPLGHPAFRASRRTAPSVGNFIDAASAQGMASQDTPNSQPAAANSSVFAQCFKGVNRAARLEPAVPADIRAEHESIRVDRDGQHPCERTHGGRSRPRCTISTAWRRSASNWSKRQVAVVPGFPIRT